MNKIILGFVVVGLLAVSLLASQPLVGSEGSVAYTCSTATPPTLNGVLEEDEWSPTCSFDRSLRGIPDNSTGVLVYPPFNQSITLHLMNDDSNHYFAWNWTHHWLNNTINDDDSSPDKYMFAVGFDFDHDRIWEDRDNNPHTLDDTLVLIDLAFTIGEPNATGWLPIYIPAGGYVLSWNATANALEDITQAPGPLDRDGNSVDLDYAAGRSPGETVSNTTYAYAIELAVPNVLFHSTAGFGFGLGQETNFVKDGTQYNETYGWSWPNEWAGYYFAVNDPYVPRYEGLLTDFVPPLEAVGGFANEPTGDVLLVAGDISVNQHGTKPAGVGFQIGRDMTPLGFISGMLTSPQPSIYDTNTAWINNTSGRPFDSIPSDIIFAVGGPGINAVSHYYETTSVVAERALITFAIEGDYYVWRDASGTEVYRDLRSSSSDPLANSDIFVIQTLRDTDNRLVVLIYGTHYYGTWAGAWYFKFVVYPNYISNWKDSYYIVRWTDAPSGTGFDYTPDLGDTYTILAQG